MYCYSSASLIEGNTMLHNTARQAASVLMLVDSYNTFLNNVMCFNNSTSYEHGTIWITDSNPIFINNTISHNTCGGVCIDNVRSNPVFINTIIWDDYEQMFTLRGGMVTTNYCDIRGGYYGEGLIDVEPMFRDPDNDDFHLMATICGDPYDSPCIDMGDPLISDNLLDCAWGLGNIRSDIGAYGGADSAISAIDSQTGILPQNYSISDNYPNPFNASTLIRYELPVRSCVRISIYDILGRMVCALQDGEKPAGYHQVIWNADDISSGVYFYKIQAGDYKETRKMMLMK